MDYYSNVQFIDDLDAKIKQKENELLLLNFMNTNDIVSNTLKRQLESEIVELRTQRVYHANVLSDQLMKNCTGCSRCQNGQCF